MKAGLRGWGDVGGCGGGGRVELRLCLVQHVLVILQTGLIRFSIGP